MEKEEKQNELINFETDQKNKEKLKSDTDQKIIKPDQNKNKNKNENKKIMKKTLSQIEEIGFDSQVLTQQETSPLIEKNVSTTQIELETIYDDNNESNDIENLKEEIQNENQIQNENIKNKSKTKTKTKYTLYHLEKVGYKNTGFKRFVKTGYRMDYPYSLCIKSIFKMHNQTISIWVHLLGAVSFIFFAIYAYSKDTIIHSTKESKLILGIYLIGGFLCLLSSALYHTFECHSIRVYNILLSVDMTGVIIMMETSFIPIIFFNFPNHKKARNGYLIGMAILGLIMIYMIWWQRRFLDRRPFTRTFAFSSLGFYSLIPLIHMVAILSSKSAIEVFWRVMLVLVLYFIGAILTVFQIPERFSSIGRFDVIGNSHQLWHMFVAAAAIVHFFNVLYWIEHPSN